MNTIRIHNPCNENTRYYRYYNLFWDKFTDELKKRFNVEENRYFEHAHSMRYPIKLNKGITDDFLVLECEYVIENLNNGEFVILSVADDLSNAVLNERKNPFLKKVLISQFNPKKIFDHVGYENIHKYSPWQYFQAQLIDLDPFFKKRLNINTFINKLYFRGTSLEDREIIFKLKKDIISDSFYPIPSEDYFNELINYNIALSIDGRGEFCYRDIECFALGVPIMRFEFESVFYDKLIPNFHYISIPRPSDMISYKRVTNDHVTLMENRFNEVINDISFLKFVSKNAREYYEKNCEINSLIKKTYNLLNLSDWE